MSSISMKTARFPAAVLSCCGRPSRRRLRSDALLADQLEPRTLLAALTWDGGGDGSSWSDPLNWSSDTLPGASDHAAIPAGVGPVTVRGLTRIGGVSSLSPVRLSGRLLATDAIELLGGGALASSSRLRASGVRLDGVFSAGGKNLAVNADRATLAPGFSLRNAEAVRVAARSGIDAAGMIRAREIDLVGGLDSTVIVSARFNVSSLVGAGGTVHISGLRIRLDQALINASGPEAGGEVKIGGERSGRGGPGSLLSARYTDITPGTVIRANATRNGPGGTVIVWSDDTTGFHGTIAAKGGPLGGRGGFIETSGALVIDATGTASASAPAGTPGSWLLDPRDVTITNATTSGGTFLAGTFTPSANNAVFNISSLNSALNGGTSVTVTTSNPAGTQNGNITLSSPVSKTDGNANTLTLRAAGSITLNATITNTFFPLTLRLFANDASQSAEDPQPTVGSVAINAAISLNGGSFQSSGVGFTLSSPITTSGGSVVINHTGNVAINAGINASGNDIVIRAGNSNAGVGNLTFASSPIIRGRNFQLSAGSISGGTSTGATVNVSSGSPVFGGGVTAGTAPTSLEIAQDGAITDATLPSAGQYQGSISNMLLNLQSFNSSISLATASKVAGTRLSAVARTSITFPATFNPALGSLTLTAQTGSIQLSSTNLTSSTSLSFTGPVLVGPGTAVTASFGTAFFSSSIDALIGGGSLVVNCFGSPITIGASVGATQQLASLNLNSVSSNIGGSFVYASGAVSIIGTLSLPTVFNAVVGSFYVGGIVQGIGNNQSIALSVTTTGGSITLSGVLGVNEFTSIDLNAGTGVIFLGGTIDSSGPQTYTGIVKLLNDTTITANGNVTFAGTVDSADNQQFLDVGASASIIFAGEIGAVIPLSSLAATVFSRGGPSIFIGGNITTASNQIYTGPVLLTANAVLLVNQDANGDIVFSSTVDSQGGPWNLTTISGGGFDGLVLFFGNVGASTPLQSLTSVVGLGGTNVYAATIRAIAAQNYSGVLATGNPAPFSTTFIVEAGDFTTQNALGTNAVDVTITTDSISLLGQVSGTASLTIQPFTLSQNISIGGSGLARERGTTGLSIDQSEFNNLQDGFTDVTFGAAAGSGTIDFQTGSVIDPTTLRAGGAGGKVNINTTTSGSGNGGIDVQGSGTTTFLYASIITQGGAITIRDAIRLEAAGLQLSTKALLGAQGPITIDGGLLGIRSAQGQGRTLSIDSGSAPTIINGPIGTQIGGFALGSFTIATTGPISLSGPFIWTSGAQSFAGPVTLTGPLTLGTTGGNITFGSSVAGTQNLTIAPGTGTVNFGGSIGSPSSPLATISVNAGGSRTFSQPVFADSLVINGGTITFDADAAIDSGVLLSGLLTGLGNIALAQTFTWLGGTIDGTGDFNLGVAGTLVITGSAKTLGKDLNVAGTVIWDSGNIALTSGARITTLPTGNFNIQTGADLTGAGPSAFINSGTLTKTDSGTTRIFTTLSSTGATSLLAGVFQVASFAIFGPTSSLTGAGTLAVLAGATAILQGSANFSTLQLTTGSAATLGSTLAISIITSSGLLTLDPLASVSATTFTQTAAGTLRTNASSATIFGRITTTGAATLAGTLQIAYTGAYLPVRGTSFQVIAAASTVGSFATLVAPTVGTNNKTVLLSQPTGARILFTALADFDNSGSLTPADIFTFLNAYFTGTTPLGQVDINNDGVRSPADIFAFLNIYFLGF